MPEFLAGTYPYAKRQAIADAVQAGLLPHTQQTEGDVAIRGAVTVLVRVTPPTEYGVCADHGILLCDMCAPTNLAPEVARGCATKATP